MKAAPVLLLLFALPLMGQQKTIDFTTQLKGLEGKALTNGDPKDPQPITLGDEVALALDAPLQTDSDETQTHKIARAKLAEKLVTCKACSLSITETALILERANKVLPALLYGQVVKILDPTQFEKADL